MTEVLNGFNKNISCSWAKDIPENFVVFGNAENPEEWDEDGGIIHLVKEDNFIYLKKVDDEPCRLKIEMKDECTLITNISVVSEAKIIELYGKYGEYIKTSKCDLLSEVNDTDIYATQTDLVTASELTIKFPNAKEGIWLCGVKILVKNAQPSVTTSFDFNLVEDKLKRSNVPITDKAEKFKKFLQDYASAYSGKGKTNVDPYTLFRIMEGECKSHLKPVGDASRNISNFLSNMMPSAMRNMDKNASQEEEKADDNSPGSSSVPLKQYVDEQMHQLEERIQDNLKQQIQELESKQNEKLDAILALLKKSTVH